MLQVDPTPNSHATIIPSGLGGVDDDCLGGRRSDGGLGGGEAGEHGPGKQRNIRQRILFIGSVYD